MISLSDRIRQRRNNLAKALRNAFLLVSGFIPKQFEDLGSCKEKDGFQNISARSPLLIILSRLLRSLILAFYRSTFRLALRLQDKDATCFTPVASYLGGVHVPPGYRRALHNRGLLLSADTKFRDNTSTAVSLRAPRNCSIRRKTTRRQIRYISSPSWIVVAETAKPDEREKGP